MAKFNATVRGPVTLTQNMEGAPAYQESPKLELISLVLTSFLKDQFYKSADAQTARLRELITKVPPKFAAQAALYARRAGMRSITHVIAGELAGQIKGEQWTKRFYEKVVRRVDDITEILGYYLGLHGEPVPNSLKKGLGQAFSTFNAYQLAKYRAEDKKVKLIDAVNLLHPKPTERNRDALAMLMKGTLKSTETWESMLSAAGKDDEEREGAWRHLLTERKLGYFALLRNLRNIMQQAPELIGLACEQLLDQDAIKGSMVFPFRFQTAFEEIAKTNDDATRHVLAALDRAVDLSLANVPKFDGRTLVVLDVSGSMQGKPLEIGSLFASVLYKANEAADLMLFATQARYVTQIQQVPTMYLAADLRRAAAQLGGGTDFHTIFRTANRAYDRIVILSDMQGWIGYETPVHDFNLYKVKYKCNPRVYSFNLQDYGTLQFPEPNVYALSGFSDKVFDLMRLLDGGRRAMIEKIEKIEL